MRGPDYGVLFSNMQPDEANAVIQKLDSEKIPHRLADGGATILVPREDVYEQRVALAGEGVVKAGGGTGWELFDRTNLGMTDFQEKIAKTRATEGELQRTISGLATVQSARVHIATPQDSLFVETQRPTTASVAIATRPGMQLSPQEVRGITQLVAGAVEGLKPENVTIVDQNGTILRPVGGRRHARSVTAAARSSTRKTSCSPRRSTSRTSRSRSRVCSTRRSARTAPPSRVATDMNFDANATETKTYAPQGTVLSEKTKRESLNGTGARAGAIGVPGHDDQRRPHVSRHAARREPALQQQRGDPQLPGRRAERQARRRARQGDAPVRRGARQRPAARSAGRDGATRTAYVVSRGQRREDPQRDLRRRGDRPGARRSGLRRSDPVRTGGARRRPPRGAAPRPPCSACRSCRSSRCSRSSGSSAPDSAWRCCAARTFKPSAELPTFDSTLAEELPSFEEHPMLDGTPVDRRTDSLGRRSDARADDRVRHDRRSREPRQHRKAREALAGRMRTRAERAHGSTERTSRGAQLRRSDSMIHDKPILTLGDDPMAIVVPIRTRRPRSRHVRAREGRDPDDHDRARARGVDLQVPAAGRSRARSCSRSPKISTVPIDKRDAVVQEAYQRAIALKYINEGGIEYAKEILERSFGAGQADDMTNRLFAALKHGNPLELVKKTEPAQLLEFIKEEHPQTIALILVYMSPDQAGAVLSQLEPELQGEVAMRIAILQKTAPEILEQFDELLGRRLIVSGATSPRPAACSRSRRSWASSTARRRRTSSTVSTKRDPDGRRRGQEPAVRLRGHHQPRRPRDPARAQRGRRQGPGARAQDRQRRPALPRLQEHVDARGGDAQARTSTSSGRSASARSAKRSRTSSTSSARSKRTARSSSRAAARKTGSYDCSGYGAARRQRARLAKWSGTRSMRRRSSRVEGISSPCRRRSSPRAGEPLPVRRPLGERFGFLSTAALLDGRAAARSPRARSPPVDVDAIRAQAQGCSPKRAQRRVAARRRAQPRARAGRRCRGSRRRARSGRAQARARRRLPAGRDAADREMNDMLVDDARAAWRWRAPSATS